MNEVVERFSRRRVLVIGDVMLDEYVWGDVRRISPEAPVPVVEIRRRTSRPGGAANVAANVVSLGGSVYLIGVTGADAEAARVRLEMQALGIPCDGLLADPGRPTTTKTRIIAHQQQVARLDAEARIPAPPELEAALLDRLRARMGRSDICVVSDYQKGAITERVAQAAIQFARAAGVPVVVDPKSRDFSPYRGATVVTPNLAEAERAANHELNGNRDLALVTRRLLRLLDGAALLITRGAEGMSLFRRGLPPVHIPAKARHVFDVTGAGDTAVGALALGLAAGLPLEDATRAANAAAGLVVGKLGTATVTPDELKAALARPAAAQRSPGVGSRLPETTSCRASSG